MIAHPTGNGNTWSLPKGIKDVGETERQAALRETWEETGLDLRHRVDLRDHGRFSYTIEKDFHLFSMRHFSTVDCSKLYCTSTFEQYGRQVPEINGYSLVSFIDALKLLNKRQSKIFSTVLKNL